MKEKGLSLLLQLLDDMVGLLDPELMPTSSEAEVVCVCVCVCVCVLYCGLLSLLSVVTMSACFSFGLL